MAANSKSKPKPKWLIDLHGIKEALTSRSNAKARVIDAIRSGEMLVIRSVQTELCAAFPDIWPDFVEIKPKTYQDTAIPIYNAAGQLQGMHGSSLLGGMPDFAHFEAVALARSLDCKLISAGKALGHCQDIASKCGIPVNDIASISAVA
jgi:hypothetical protein